MGLIELGGWMMWPLLAVSVAALAIVVERALVFMGCPFPDSRFPGLVLEAMRTGDVRPLAARLEAVHLDVHAEGRRPDRTRRRRQAQ